MDWLRVVAGAMTGLVVGITGVGGGALMTPILLLFLNTAPLTAIGTDLWFAAATKVSISGIHQRHGLIDWQVVRRLWSGSLPASALTLAVLQFTHARVESYLTVAIGAAVLTTAIGVLVQKQLQGQAERIEGRSRLLRSWQASATTLAGAFLGLIVTLTSVGAGALGVVCLLYLYPSRLSTPRLIATDVAHAIPLAMFAGIGHLFVGHVDLYLLRDLLAGSVPGGILGALLSRRLPHAWLRLALAIVLVFVGIKLLGGM